MLNKTLRKELSEKFAEQVNALADPNRKARALINKYKMDKVLGLYENLRGSDNEELLRLVT